MRKNIIVFAGSVKSRIIVDCLKPSVTFWHNEVSSKQKYIKCLSTIDHENNDVICVNWPYITPEYSLNYKNIYTIHESLLPSYSGCAPVNWSIIEGSSLFGVTLFRQTKVVDGGDILFQDGFYCPREGAAIVFKKMELCYEKCASFIRNNSLSNCVPLSDFGIRTYYKKRKPVDNIVENEIDPHKLVNLFLSTTIDYPLIYKQNMIMYKIYAIKVFGKLIDYYPLGEMSYNLEEIKFYNDTLVLIGVKIND